MTQTRRSSALKPDYDIKPVQPRHEAGMTIEERRARLVRRVHDAMLTCAAQQDDGPRTKWTWSPQHVVEFADRVGEEEKQAPKQRFRPTPAQVDDMLPALALLDGLRDEYLDVVFLRALLEFYGHRKWEEAVADRMRKRPHWVKEAYDRALIQAARAAGMLSPVPDDYAIVGIAALGEDGLLTTYVAAVAKPRQTLADVKAKSPTQVVDAFAVWVPGKPLAQRVVEDFRRANDPRRRGSWIRKNPFDVEDELLLTLQHTGVSWRVQRLIDVMAAPGETRQVVGASS